MLSFENQRFSIRKHYLFIYIFYIKKEDEAAESCTIDGESPVVIFYIAFFDCLSRVAWGTWNPV